MIKFGTGGWRAVIGDDFTKANIQLLARALCLKMKEENAADKGIVIGYDRRFLAKEAMHWAGQVFAAEGVTAYLVNKSAPTPLVMFYVMKHEMPYGMMITASHNPAIYNGIKVFTEGGRDASAQQTDEIEKYIARIEHEEVKSMEYDKALEAGLIQEIYPLNEYLDNIIDNIDMQAIRNSRLKIALDPMYGVSETSIKTILLTARCEVDTIHERHDTLFGGKLPAPTAATLRPLQNFVLDGKCDIGIATDGDADRLGVIDDKGKFLHPNDIMVLLYYYLVKYKGWQGPVVRNICTTHMLDKVAQEFGEKCYEVPVGFKHISAKMTETNAVIGGESSGGLTVRGHIHGKDGVYAACLLVEMIAVTGKKTLRNLCRHRSRMRQDIHGRKRLQIQPGEKRSRTKNPPGRKTTPRPPLRNRPRLLLRWQQSLLQKRRLGSRPLLRHRTPDPNLLRNAGRTTGKRSLPNLRTVPRPELIK